MNFAVKKPFDAPEHFTMRLLLVEDDKILGDGLRAGLSMEGYAVDWLTDGNAAGHALQSQPYEMVVLDLNLPGKSGMEVLKEMRFKKLDTPVLILTAKDTIPDRVQGLDGGADDFVVKPFDLDEVLARLRALQRRHAGRSLPVIEHGDVILDPASHQVTYDNRPVELSQREFEVLKFLLENKGRVFSRARIEDALYPWNEEIESNAIQVHIHHLRRKLAPNLIRTVRSVGYIIDNDSA